jgi:hypothetical protein
MTPLNLPPRLKDDFWQIIEECLIQLHHKDPVDANQLVQDLRQKIENPPAGVVSELFYHSEPFDVACDLAGSQLRFDQGKFDYFDLLKKHYW